MMLSKCLPSPLSVTQAVRKKKITNSALIMLSVFFVGLSSCYGCQASGLPLTIGGYVYTESPEPLNTKCKDTQLVVLKEPDSEYPYLTGNVGKINVTWKKPSSIYDEYDGKVTWNVRFYVDGKKGNALTKKTKKIYTYPTWRLVRVQKQKFVPPPEIKNTVSVTKLPVGPPGSASSEAPRSTLLKEVLSPHGNSAFKDDHVSQDDSVSQDDTVSPNNAKFQLPRFERNYTDTFEVRDRVTAVSDGKHAMTVIRKEPQSKDASCDEPNCPFKDFRSSNPGQDERCHRCKGSGRVYHCDYIMQRDSDPKGVEHLAKATDLFAKPTTIRRRRLATDRAMDKLYDEILEAQRVYEERYNGGKAMYHGFCKP